MEFKRSAPPTVGARRKTNAKAGLKDETKGWFSLVLNNIQLYKDQRWKSYSTYSSDSVVTHTDVE